MTHPHAVAPPKLPGLSKWAELFLRLVMENDVKLQRDMEVEIREAYEYLAAKVWGGRKVFFHVEVSSAWEIQDHTVFCGVEGASTVLHYYRYYYL